MRHLTRLSCLRILTIFAAMILPKADAQTKEYSTSDVTIFGGVQTFDMLRSRPDHNFADGLIGGLRLTQDFSRYVGLEESFSYATNNLRLYNVQPYPVRSVGAGVRNYQLSVGPVFHFTPRESKVRPFVKVGVGGAWYDPTSDAADMFRRPENRYLGVNRFNMTYGPAGFWGAGLKINASRRVGFRFDFGGMLSQTPHFKMPDFPRGAGTVYIPRHGTEHPLSATAGITFRFGLRSDEPPPPPPAPPTQPEPPKPEPPVIQLGAITGMRDVCAGDAVQLSVTASATPPGQQLTYRWTVNGVQTGGNSPSISIPTDRLTGPQNVVVEVSAGESSKSSSARFAIRTLAPPTVKITNLPTTIKYGEQFQVAATATGSDCGGPATIAYTVNEGTISGNTFDSNGMAFDMSNRNRTQTRVVRVTATATDQRGGTAKAEGEITVVLSPTARRLDDLVFPANNSRVNNCAKRILLEQLTPLLRDNPESQVILIGHTDGKERAGVVDRARVLNAAAVLSAGTGICPQLELSRVKGSWVGTTQGSDPRPGLCGGSTEVRERRGQAIGRGDSRAMFRRVEVWFVPEGAALPAELQNVQPVPAGAVTPLGCPK